MISFFRKLRQKLLKENRVTRYLIYALGEILLVVIGILIALWVNNLNQEALNDAREEKILLGLKAEFETAAIELQTDLDGRNRHYKATSRLLDFHTGQKELKIPQDSIQPILTSFISTRFYSTGHPVLEDLSSSGGLELIKSEKVRQSLAAYLQERNRYTVVEERESEFVYDQLIPVVSEFLDYSKVEKGLTSSEELESTFRNEKGNKRYGSVLQLRLVRIRISRNYGLRLLETIEDVLDQLSKELTK